jgi:hypothetical protein
MKVSNANTRITQHATTGSHPGSSSFTAGPLGHGSVSLLRIGGCERIAKESFHSAQQLSLEISFVNASATIFSPSDIVGYTCNMPAKSSILAPSRIPIAAS